MVDPAASEAGPGTVHHGIGMACVMGCVAGTGRPKTQYSVPAETCRSAVDARPLAIDANRTGLQPVWALHPEQYRSTGYPHPPYLASVATDPSLCPLADPTWLAGSAAQSEHDLHGWRTLVTRLHIKIAIPGALLAAAVTPLLASLALAADPTVVVRPGDTLSGIAVEHGLEVDMLARLNGIENPNRIYAGETLRLAAAPAAPASTAAAGAERTHTVQPGENLTWIARRYGVSVASLATANAIVDPSRIYAGDRLTIPGAVAPAPAPAAPAAPAAAAPAAPAAAQRSHTVQPGENLTWIGRQYGVTISAIVSANAIADASRIYAGQRLVIPGAAPAAAASAAASGMPTSMAELVARRSSVRAVIVEEAARLGVPASFALAVAWQESGWQQNVTSHAGAVGVMQLLPTTADWVSAAMLHAPVDVSDTRSNVRGGVRLLAHYLDRYDGSRELTLAAYYQGQAATDRHGVYGITRPYIASILTLETLFD
jgi:LysM repeat protein